MLKAARKVVATCTFLCFHHPPDSLHCHPHMANCLDETGFRASERRNGAPTETITCTPKNKKSALTSAFTYYIYTGQEAEPEFLPRHLNRTKRPSHNISPLYSLHSVLLQILVALAEMTIAEEAAIGTERTGMRTAEHQMAAGVDEGCLSAGRCTPQQEHQMLSVLAEQADDLVGESLPTMPAMAERLMGAHSETGVEKEYTLTGPAAQIAALRDRRARLGLYLLEDIAERGREIDPIIDAETESLGLAHTVIRILTQYDHLDLVKWGAVESIEDEVARREACTRGVLCMNKADEFAKVRFGKLVAQYSFPGWLDIHICHTVGLVFNQALAGHLGRLLQTHDVQDAGCHVGQNAVLHLGSLVLCHIDEGHRIQ